MTMTDPKYIYYIPPPFYKQYTYFSLWWELTFINNILQLFWFFFFHVGCDTTHNTRQLIFIFENSTQYCEPNKRKQLLVWESVNNIYNSKLSNLSNCQILLEKIGMFLTPHSIFSTIMQKKWQIYVKIDVNFMRTQMK